MVSRSTLEILFRNACPDADVGLTFGDFKQLVVQAALAAYADAIGHRQAACTLTLFEHMDTKARSLLKCNVKQVS